jgi:hypothetical protein
VVLDITNFTNSDNDCCLVLQPALAPATIRGDVEHWLPAIVNLGFTYRWRSR